MSEWIRSTLDSMGYPGVIFFMFLENVFPPIPSELVMPYSGYTAAKGDLTLWGVILAGGLGSVLGAIPLYYLGLWIGAERLKNWSGSHGHWLLLSPREIDRAEKFFDRHGRKTVFLARMIPGIRSLISIPAGMYRMNMVQFLIWTAAGSLIWSGLLAWGGHALGDNYTKIGKYLNPVVYVVLGGMVLWYIIYVFRKKKAKHKRKREERAEGG